jgi:hypothetical protein
MMHGLAWPGRDATSLPPLRVGEAGMRRPGLTSCPTLSKMNRDSRPVAAHFAAGRARNADARRGRRTTPMPDGPNPPPASCPIGWQPTALAPVFYGMRTLGPSDAAPVAMRLFFPSLDGAVASAPLLDGCGRYPLVIFVHGHCVGDVDHFQRWVHLPAQLARSGYVVAVPQLAGIESGLHPSQPDHPDLSALSDVVEWLRSDWEHADVLDAARIAVVGHSFGALLGARFAAAAEAVAFAGLSGVWQDWPSGPSPLTLRPMASLLVWGGPLDFFTALSDSAWNELPPPKHRAMWSAGEHWDYLVGSVPPCSAGAGPCPAVGIATADLVTMFLGKYLAPELAPNLVDDIPDTLRPPQLVLSPEQQFFAGGHLLGFGLLDGNPSCGLEQQADPWALLANRRSKETHSRIAPCAWVHLIVPPNRRFAHVRPEGYRWCDFCFPALADG